jgi:Methyltransferase domain
VLEALQANDRGHLWSIDLPYPFDHALHDQIGAAVSDACRARWSYLEGSSSRRLPPLIDEVGHVEVFIHDSLHTAKNTLFELEQAASAMPPGGVMLVDDIALHKGFETFAGRHPEYRTIVCPSADRTGLFGIAVNTARCGGAQPHAARRGACDRDVARRLRGSRRLVGRLPRQVTRVSGRLLRGFAGRPAGVGPARCERRR